MLSSSEDARYKDMASIGCEASYILHTGQTAPSIPKTGVPCAFQAFATSAQPSMGCIAPCEVPHAHGSVKVSAAQRETPKAEHPRREAGSFGERAKA